MIQSSPNPKLPPLVTPPCPQACSNSCPRSRLLRAHRLLPALPSSLKEWAAALIYTPPITSPDLIRRHHASIEDVRPMLHTYDTIVPCSTPIPCFDPVLRSHAGGIFHHSVADSIVWPPEMTFPSDRAPILMPLTFQVPNAQSPACFTNAQRCIHVFSAEEFSVSRLDYMFLTAPLPVPDVRPMLPIPV